jgi:hypothetical protein
MKRIVPAVLVLALALPATATASKRTYSGAVDAASGTIEFTLKKKKATKRNPRKTSVRNFTFVGVPVTCDAGPATTSGTLTFGMRVIRKQFSADADDGAGSNLHVEGTLKQRGKRTVGTLSVFGEVPLDPDGAQRGVNCETGELAWEAERE